MGALAHGRSGTSGINAATVVVRRIAGAVARRTKGQTTQGITLTSSATRSSSSAPKTTAAAAGGGACTGTPTKVMTLRVTGTQWSRVASLHTSAPVRRPQLYAVALGLVSTSSSSTVSPHARSHQQPHSSRRGDILGDIGCVLSAGMSAKAPAQERPSAAQLLKLCSSPMQDPRARPAPAWTSPEHKHKRWREQQQQQQQQHLRPHHADDAGGRSVWGGLAPARPVQRTRGYPQHFGQQRRQLHTSRRVFAKTHYDVLGVSRNASQADIKQSYIELSKQLHPDKAAHKSPKEQDHDHKRYQRVTEAYNVLSKPIERRAYDSSLFQNEGMSAAAASGFRPPAYQHRDIYDNVHFGESPYKIFSNTTIVMLAIVWMLIGIAWHYFAISKTKTELEQHLERLSREAAKDHALARKRARDNGYKKQLEILMAQQKAQFDDRY